MKRPTLSADGAYVLCHSPDDPDDGLAFGMLPSPEMAEYIVTAVNSHADLVDACEKLVASYGIGPRGGSYALGELYEARQAAIAAIAKIKGERA